jgi:hypothetical protein
MDLPPAPRRWLRAIGTALVAVVAFVPVSSAQAAPDPAAPPIADSAQAVAIACAVAQSLRRAAERYRCRVERYAETSTEYIVRVFEDAAPGAPPLVLNHSEVRLEKRERSVIVTRSPEL